MKKQRKINSWDIVLITIALAFVLSCNAVNNLTSQSKGTQSPPPANTTNDAPNTAKQFPPLKGYEKYTVPKTEKVSLTSQHPYAAQTNMPGSTDGVMFLYRYTDGRFDKFYSPDSAINFQITKFASPAAAQTYLKNIVDKTIPITDRLKIKLPKCIKEKSDSDNFWGPNKLVKRLKHPNGSDIVIYHSGDFNFADCTRADNNDEYAIWTDGEYYFEVNALPRAGEGKPAYGRAEEFTRDYFTALNQKVTPPA